MNKKLAIVCVVVILSAGTAAFAFVDLPPYWRGQEGSTCQKWTFPTADPYPPPDPSVSLPGCFGNEYGDPTLSVSGQWSDVVGPMYGVWGLSGVIDAYIPNWDEPQPVKWIRLQLIWKPADLCGDLGIYTVNASVVSFGLPSEPLISVVPFDFMTMYRVADEDMGDGWWHTVFDISLYPNPPAEWITIRGDIWVDELTIDTICIPEPAMILLLGLGGLVVLRKRRT